MKLISLELENFRQFYGKSPVIKFASGEKNITVIHGANGSGKTALLNAFTWLLFETHTKGFVQTDTLANHRAVRETKPGTWLSISVALMFEHANDEYLAIREVQIEKPESDAPQSKWAKRGGDLTVKVLSNNGAMQVQDNPYDIIGKIIPKQLHNYFFFDGERIEAIVQPNPKDRKKLGDATRTLLQLEAMMRAENRLNTDVKKTFRDRLAKISNADEKDILSKISSEEALIEESTRRIEDINNETDNFESLVKTIDKSLRDGQKTRQWQEQREKLELDKKQQNEFITEAEDELRKMVSKQSYPLFLKPVISRINAKTQELRRRGELPGGIKRDFVEKLLTEKVCICGAALEAGTDAADSVANWRQRSGLQAVEERVLSLSEGVRHMEESADRLPGIFNNVVNKISKCESRLNRIESQLSQVSEQIKDTGELESAKDLETQRDNHLNKIRSLGLDKGRAEQQIQTSQAELESLRRDEKKFKIQNQAQKLAVLRLEACEKSVEVLKNIREAYENLFRVKLQERLVTNFQKLSSTPYVPVLESDYSVHLVNNAGGEEIRVAASQGENQVLGLTFISSIISLARDLLDKTKAKDIVGSSSPSSYPLVMDSPFGALDPTYRENVATLVPELTDQVVIMVSATQWKGQVENAMKDRVGSHYVLCYNTPSTDAKEYNLTIGNQDIPVVSTISEPDEFTQIIPA